jgi:hypothetical protein
MAMDDSGFVGDARRNGVSKRDPVRRRAGVMPCRPTPSPSCNRSLPHPLTPFPTLPYPDNRTCVRYRLADNHDLRKALGRGEEEVTMAHYDPFTGRAPGRGHAGTCGANSNRRTRKGSTSRRSTGPSGAPTSYASTSTRRSGTNRLRYSSYSQATAASPSAPATGRARPTPQPQRSCGGSCRSSAHSPSPRPPPSTR